MFPKIKSAQVFSGILREKLNRNNFLCHDMYMIFCDMGSIRKLISSCKTERKAAFWNNPSSCEHCFSSCRKSSGRAASHSNEADSCTSVFKSVWCRGFIFSSSSSAHFFIGVFSGLQFRYIRVQCHLTHRLDLSAWTWIINSDFCKKSLYSLIKMNELLSGK